VNWPTGTGGKGNEGVAAFVQRLGGAIGYVEYAYAKQNHMTHVNLQNASGAVVQPTADAFKAAAAGAEWNKSFYQILTNQPGKDAWPIAGATFILLHKTQDKPAQGAEVMKFFDWAYKGGDDAAKALDYVPLPDSVKNQIRTTWKSNVKDASGKAVY
jgi:phosphate transport system substrate-binding protein